MLNEYTSDIWTLMLGNQQLSLALPLVIQAMAVEQEAFLLVILRKVQNFIPLAVCPDWYTSLRYTGSPLGPSVRDNNKDVEMSSADMTDIIRWEWGWKKSGWAGRGQTGRRCGIGPAQVWDQRIQRCSNSSLTGGTPSCLGYLDT